MVAINSQNSVFFAAILRLFGPGRQNFVPVKFHPSLPKLRQNLRDITRLRVGTLLGRRIIPASYFVQQPQ